jgi:di/tricarboxylate transporter
MTKHEQGSKMSPPALHDDEDPSGQDHWLHMQLKIVILVLVVFGAPYICRNSGLSAAARCVVLIISVLFLNLAEVMPLFCTALFIPVLGTMCEVLGNSRSMVATSTLLVGSIFNNISFLVLGALVINGIFVKCRLERRLMACLLQRFAPDSKYFLLFLLLGGMAMCSVLYSGSLVLLSALRPLIAPADGKNALEPRIAKRLLLAVAFCANAGSVWLPISSPVNLITIALLREFEHDIGLVQWVMVAIPVSTIAVLILWFVMLYLYPDSTKSTNPDSPLNSPRGEQMQRQMTEHEQAEQEATVELTYAHYFFLAVSVMALLGITVFMPALEPIIGHGACISLLVVVMAFGSGFMSRDEFLQLDWDLLMLVGGTNVMAFLVRETGLGADLSSKLISSEFFTMLPYWGFLVLLIISTVTISTTVGHTLTGVLLLPLIVAIGLKLQAAETTALLCAIAIPFGMGLPQSSFDNSSAYTESRKYGRQRVQLTQRDFRIPGLAITIVAALLLLFLGYGVCVYNYGLPPPVVVSEVSETPEKLKPKVVRENRPEEAKEVSYNKMMVNWKEFLDKPDEKAFAVGELKEGLRTRPWAASWNHETQEDANRAALEECERLADKCRLIYPRDGDPGEKAEDIREAVKKNKKDNQAMKPTEGASFLRRGRSFLASYPRSMLQAHMQWHLAPHPVDKDSLFQGTRMRTSRSPVVCGHVTNHTCG